MEKERNYCNVWEDREIKFDIPNVQKRLRGGEKILEVITNIEDTKGNPRDEGRLVLTNLRMMWHSLTTSNFSLSIGYLCIQSMTTKSVVNKGRIPTKSVSMMAVSHNSRFEFVFTNVGLNREEVFAPLFSIYKNYKSTPLYREIKMRSTVVSDGQLVTLPLEQIYSTVNGVWNLSADQGNLGSFIITNIRIVWFADINETFNISLPYIQIAEIRVRSSKYGPALVINTTETGGSYMLGFRIDPPENLSNIYQEVVALYDTFLKEPIIGVTYEAANPKQSKEDVLSVDDIQEIDDSGQTEVYNNFTNYLAEGVDDNAVSRIPFYCKELGFAMQQMRDGYKVTDLWKVVA